MASPWISSVLSSQKEAVGWGGMPLHMIELDIAAGTLVVLDTDEMPRTGYVLLYAFHRASAPPASTVRRTGAIICLRPVLIIFFSNKQGSNQYPCCRSKKSKIRLSGNKGGSGKHCHVMKING
jgi:hypothetical protein